MNLLFVEGVFSEELESAFYKNEELKAELARETDKLTQRSQSQEDDISAWQDKFNTAQVCLKSCLGLKTEDQAKKSLLTRHLPSLKKIKKNCEFKKKVA